jgi:hypothetical protein
MMLCKKEKEEKGPPPGEPGGCCDERSPALSQFEAPSHGHLPGKAMMLFSIVLFSP